MTFHNVLRQTRIIIYRLKRQYGLKLVYYRPETETHNVETGEIHRVWRSFVIQRAVVLPSTLDRSFVYDLTFIAANNNFVEGGYFDRNKRNVILDVKDVPKEITPNSNDHVEFGKERYEILSTIFVEDRNIYFLNLQSLSNDDPVGQL